jgi:galactokinase
MEPGKSHNLDDSIAGILRTGAFFRPGDPVWIARAPGRLDVLGGNVDYTGGLVLQMPVREAVWAAAQPDRDDVIRVLNPDAARFGWASQIEFPIHLLGDAEAIDSRCSGSADLHWGRYVLGGFHLLRKRYGVFATSGARLFLASDLPPNCGLASSAALEVAVLKAAAAVSGIALSGVRLAECAQWVENVVAQSACGIMDQAAIVLGRENCLQPLVCQPCTPLEPIRLPDHLRFWGIDSMAHRATRSAAYEQARAAAFMGYKMICRWENIEPECDAASVIPRWADARWRGYLSNLRPEELRVAFERKLPEAMAGGDFLDRFGIHTDPFTAVEEDVVYPVRAAVRYAVEENHRIQTVRALLTSITAKEDEETLRVIGELLFQCHRAYAECGLGSADCDRLAAMAREFGFYGAKMTGGGGGGVVTVFGRADQDGLLRRLATDYAAVRGEEPRIFEGSSDGSDHFGVRSVAAHALANIH